MWIAVIWLIFFYMIFPRKKKSSSQPLIPIFLPEKCVDYTAGPLLTLLDWCRSSWVKTIPVSEPIYKAELLSQEISDEPQ